MVVLNAIKFIERAHTASNKFILMHICIQSKYSIFTSGRTEILVFPLFL